jgi:SET domain-containing protein
MQQNILYILDDADKGRCVFAGKEFAKGDIIEICPIIKVSSVDRKVIHETGLHDYYFVWGAADKEAAIALGYGSLYNHSSTPNAQFVNDLKESCIIIECIVKINAGQEILLNYIDDTVKDKVWFEEK